MAEHTEIPTPQLIAHTPLAQSWPVGQAIPQPPQLFRSVLVLTQTPAHAVCPGGHEITHTPAVHTWPPAHALPHIPQCARSV